MRWLVYVQHLAGLLNVVRTPLQIAALTYVGAGGLAGAAIVGGVMLSPAGEAVQQAVAPAGTFIESLLPGPMPTLFQIPPGPAVARQPSGQSRPVSASRPTVEVALPTVDDSAAQDDVASATPTPQARVTSPIQPAQSAQPGPSGQPGQSDQPGAVAPPAVQPGQPKLDVKPMAAMGGAVAVAPGLPAAAVAARGGSRFEVAADTAARATATRSVLGGNAGDIQRAAAVSSPTPIAVHVPSHPSTEPSAAATAVPTAPPTEAPTTAPTPVPATPVPTQAPTAVPTQAPATAPTSAPTQEPKRTAAPTQERKKTAAPTQVPAKVIVPPRPAKPTYAPTPEPTHTVPTATPDKGEHPGPAAKHPPGQPPYGRTDGESPPSSRHEGGESPRPSGHEGGESSPPSGHDGN